MCAGQPVSSTMDSEYNSPWRFATMSLFLTTVEIYRILEP